jgi:glycosyltransferase involved in cell wall biosynthesis
MGEKLNGLFIGDLVTPTGFSRVLHGILKYLNQEKIDIYGLGVNYRGDPHNYPYKIFPAFLGGDPYGLNRIRQLIEAVKFDFIFILNDAWVIDKYLEVLKKAQSEKVKIPRIIVYFPVDSEDHDPDWYKNFDIVETIITYTEFGKNVVKKAKPELNIMVLPHGIDSEDFYKKFTNRKDAKKYLFGEKQPDLIDSFIFLNANRNQPRKRLDITMKAFSYFAENKPNVKLYMHCGVRDAAIDLPKLSMRYGIDNKLIITSLTLGVQAVSIEKLNNIYNACDVGVNTSMGEGWGLTSMEHAITGAPQVVGNHSSCAEVFSDCSITVNPKLSYTFDHIMTSGKLVDPIDVADAFEKIYSNKKLYKELSEKGIEKFTRPEYQWANISKKFEEIFLGNKNADSSVA